MPKTSEHLLKYIESLVPDYHPNLHMYCSKCLLPSETDAPCSVCNSTERNASYTFSLEDQIRFYFEKTDLAVLLEKYGVKPNVDGLICDVVDGCGYAKACIRGDYSITLLIFTDGVSISGSSKTRLWPIFGVILELPPVLRQRFTIMSGVWCDKVDPPINVFMNPIVESLIEIHRKGGVIWTHPETYVEFKSSVIAPVFCADAPARAKLQNILSHGGNNGCNTCEQSMQRIPLTRAEIRAKAAGQKVVTRRAYVYQDEPATLRTSKRMILQARQAYETGKKHVEGVKGPSILSLIPKLDIAKFVYAEYMHGTCLGVVRRFLVLWICVEGPWNVSANIGNIEKYLKEICPPKNISRQPRGVSEYKQWKASEYRHWLLFYSLPCMSQFLPKEYIQHWSLLVWSMYLLLREKISEEDLVQAHLMLCKFVKDVPRLYRLRDLVFNCHELIHAALYVKTWGPLWATSAFFFIFF